ncbi:hypothetical protein BJ912DRAFT_975418 [Pholiota molesta]|nr:hypothetical protein BJ912DRAFT_975418 [Pholiota molesta]
METIVHSINVKPHPNLWFDDGSLVIQASTVRYRVHRTILEHTFDGCPLVRMMDSPHDLTMLLEAIYNPDYFHELELAIASGDEDTALKGISGVLRLGTKYQFWTTRRKPSADESVELRERLFSIIALAKSAGLPQFLPSALYRLFCTLTLDGSQDHLLIQSTQIDDTQKLWCLSGGGRCQKVRIPDDRPIGSTKCTKSTPEGITGRTSFSKIVWPRYGPTQSDGYCHKCTLAMEETYRATQQRIWNMLPDYFGFPGKSWAELKQDDAEAINQ